MNKDDDKPMFFDLLCYMSSSAKGLVDEPKLYGPLRLLESMERIIDVLEANDMSDEFYSKLKQEIKENKYTVMQDEEEFIESIDEIVAMLAKKEMDFLD
ncbi:MAG: DUF6092 family protein [Candidatus Saliniplasma sp.]